MSADDETKPYRKTAKGLDWMQLTLWAAGVGIAIGGWAHTTLWAHDSRLTTLEVQRAAALQEYLQHQERDTKVQDQIRETLRRMEDKIDSLRGRP